MKRFTSSFGCLALLFALLCFPLILSERELNYSADEAAFHFPAVRQIREHWPLLDLNRDSFSAIAPGYHYFLATVSFLTGPSRLALRTITWVVSLALLFLVWRALSGAASPFAPLVMLPLVCSNFFVKSASWVVTDNAGLLCATAALFASLLLSGRRAVWSASVLAAIATFARQLHFWTIVPAGLRTLQTWRRSEPRPSVPIFLPLLLPIAVLLLLVWSWGGMVPPAWQSVHAASGSSSFSSIAYLLAVFFGLGLFYFLAFPSGDLRGEISHWAPLSATLAGGGIALLAPTTHDHEAGRWGGYLWNLTEKLPHVGDRSFLFLLLTPLGAGLLCVMARRLTRDTDTFSAIAWLGSLLAWMTTFLPNRMAFHRYFEPMILVFLILWVLLLTRRQSAGTTPPPRRNWLRLLIAGQLGLTLLTAHYQTYSWLFRSAL